MLLPKPVGLIAGRYLERRGWVKGSASRDIHSADLHTAMSRRKDVAVATVIDVGASNGSWSDQMMRHFPKASYLLIEAQEVAHGAALARFKAVHPNVQYELCA